MTKKQARELLDKYLKGTCTPQEKILLESLDNKVFQQQAGADEQLDFDALKASIYRRLPLAERKPVSSRLIPYLAAASVAVGMLLGGLFYFAKDSPAAEQVLTEIVPGGNKAILTLGNGTKISLTDAKLGQLAARSGVRVAKTADGTLVYDASGPDAGNEQIEYHTVEAPAGGQWQVKLPDGSVVFLNAMSSITYPTRFVGSQRLVKMQGEAYFEIAHNKAMPFRVSSLGQTVEVLGTHFEVMAYRDEKLIKTTLLQGSVKVYGHGSQALLRPGEQAQLSASNIRVTSEVDLEEVVAWKNGYFKFNERIESIMAKVSRWYNVEVVYQMDANTTLAFGGKLSRSRDLKDLLKIMERTGKVHFKVEGRRITVRE
jgi:transmembrane sensor